MILNPRITTHYNPSADMHLLSSQWQQKARKECTDMGFSLTEIMHALKERHQTPVALSPAVASTEYLLHGADKLFPETETYRRLIDAERSFLNRLADAPAAADMLKKELATAYQHIHPSIGAHVAELSVNALLAQVVLPKGMTC